MLEALGWEPSEEPTINDIKNGCYAREGDSKYEAKTVCQDETPSVENNFMRFQCLTPCDLYKECDLSANQVCLVGQDGQPYCQCDISFHENKNSTEGLECIDDNECEEINFCPENSQCENLVGSYTCNCNEGFTKTLDDTACVVDDPCASSRNLCLDSQTCFGDQEGNAHCCAKYQVYDDQVGSCVDGPNTCGKFECIYDDPNEGGDKTDEAKWDQSVGGEECAITKFICPVEFQGMCGKYQCGSHQYCLEWRGEFLCVVSGNDPEQPGAFDNCDKGLALDYDTLECVDIDECLNDNGGCPHRCMNFYRTFYCYKEEIEAKKFCHHTSVEFQSNENDPREHNFSGYMCDCFENTAFVLTSFLASARSGTLMRSQLNLF
jgi:hypothetical protein